jgi:ATP-binding cassette subfamily B protein
MLAAVAIAVCNMFYPNIAKDIINNYVPNENLTLIIVFSAALLGIYVFKAICTYVVSYHGHVMGIRMQQDMRRDLFSKYQKLPISYFDNHKTGDLLSRMVNDLFEISELAHHGPENLILAVLMLIGSFIMLVRINPRLTLILFATLPFIVLFASLSRRGMSNAMKDSRRQTSVINSTLDNSLCGIRETKSYAKEHYELEKFSLANALLAKHRARAMKAMGRFETVMAFLSDFLYLLIIFVGGIFFLNKWIDAGGFTAFLLYINLFLSPVQKFVALFEQMNNGMTGFARFVEIIDQKEEEDLGTVEIDEVKGEIRFDDVSFSYEVESERMVINNLCLTVNPGKTLALVGPSGGGKTTICNLIPRFYNPTSGRILLDGVDTQNITLTSLRRSIGIVSQSIFLFDGTIKENILYGADEVDEQTMITAAKQANIHEYVMSLPDGYDTQVGERGIKLSGGQRQRIAIARAFIKNPKILILDEATSALDNATEMQVQSALDELSAGRTVIVVAHRLSTVKNADEIVVVSKNGVVERGSHEQLLALGGEYASLYAYQFKSLES